jgi:hypothetical protein
MRKFLVPFFILIFCFFCAQVFTSQTGPTTGVAGEPPLNETCAANGCHTGSAVNSGGATVSIKVLDSALNSVTSYIPKKNYTIVYSITEGTKIRYGFESCIFKSTNISTGVLAATDSKARVLGGSKKYAQHTSLGTDFSTGTAVWQIKWTAPNTNEGIATIYAAFNATNRDGNTSGDKIYTRTLTLTGTNPAGIEPESNFQPEIYYLNNMIIVNAAEGSDISIYNIGGQLIDHKISDSDKTGIFTLGYSPGIYLIKISCNGSQGFLKFVKP